MTATTPFPIATTVAKGMFADASAYGLVQGTAMPDPSTMWGLRTGLLSTSETIPIWGGVAVYENVPGGAGQPVKALGPAMGRATSVTGGSKPIAGFSVFDQAAGMVQTPQSTVPLAGSGMQVLAYQLGSRARIAVACDPGLAGLLQGGPINAAVNWDFVNQLLIPHTGTLTVSSGTYASGNGHVSLVTSAAHNLLPGDTVTVSGLTGTGGDLATANGTFTLLAGTAGTTLVYGIATGLTISSITGGSVTTGATALPVTVLDVQTTNSLTVTYDPVANVANWNYNGACALIQI